MSAHTRPVSEGAWFKSSYSGGNTTECVEVAVAGDSTVLIRDSQHPGGRRIAVRTGTWTDFLAFLGAR
ncbi:DUF397 domain-containing protein [Streptomyces longispororuber]|uniref:DUF397 domain-containing protein n=1 Tax=Streptomyces longispororuber TaxID=68230 RepID=UPI0033FD5272